jgi:hypothetical protein
LKNAVFVVPDDEPMWHIVISQVRFDEAFQSPVRLAPTRSIDIQMHNVRVFGVAPAWKWTEVFVAVRVIHNGLRKEAENLDVNQKMAIVRVNRKVGFFRARRIAIGPD